MGNNEVGSGELMDIVHRSVMAEETLAYLAPRKEGELMIDCTLGEGGHSDYFLSRFPELRVAGLDADGQILEVARKRLAHYGERVRIYHIWFNTFFREYPLGDERPDTILFDLGISVFHYERSLRGFSFRKDEQLDMRLEQGLETTAADIVNQYPENELAELIFTFGEERYSRRIARAVCRERTKGLISSTGQLADIISGTVPPEYRHGRLHPATRTFQALRIAVNGELPRLESALHLAFALLKPQGRIGVITFHSLEDRIVKRFFQEKNKPCICPSEWPICKCGGERALKILTKKPVRPSEEEVSRNPPSRSAKFRVAEKLMNEELSI